MNSANRSWAPKLKLAAAIVVGLVLLFGIVGYFAIPAAVRWGVETVASRELGREVRVESVSANPYTLAVTLRGLVVGGAPGESTPLLTIRELEANASVATLIRRAPVLDALTITGPTANIVRFDAQRFNFSDIVDRLQSKPKTSDEPAQFSVSNIEVRDGTVNFDDRPVARKHLLSELRAGIPFVSNLPVDVEIKVQPAFYARLNGSPIEVKGETRPFHETLESSIDLNFADLDIPQYLAYSPVRLDFTIPRGTLSTELRVVFRRATEARAERPAQPAQTLISGGLGISNFALAAPAANAQPLIAWRSLRVALDQVEPFERRAVIGDVALVAPVIDVVRDTAGTLNWLRFAQAPVAGAPSPERPADKAPPTARQSPPFALTLKHASMAEGTVNYADDSAGSFRMQLVNVGAEASGLTNTSNARGNVRVSADAAEGGGSAALEGEVGLAPVAGRLALTAREVKLRAPARYLAHVVNATLDGSSDVDGVVEFAAAEPAMEIKVRDLAVRSRSISVRGPDRSGANFDLDAMSIDGGELDLTNRRFTIAKLTVDGPRMLVRRLANGDINWLTVFRARQGDVAPTTEKTSAEPPAWKVELKEAVVARGDLRLEDLAVEPSVKLRVSPLAATLHNVVSDGSQRADFEVRSRFGSGGTLAANGGAKWNPLAAEVRFDARNLDVSAVRPYLAERLNAVLARAELSSRGNMTINQPAGEQAPLALTYRGNARLANLHVLDARGDSDLLDWQVLELSQIAAKIGQGPPEVAVGKVALSDFYARVIVSDQGRMNLADLIKRPGAPASTPAAAATPTATAASTTMPVDGETAAATSPPPTEPATRTATAPVAAGTDTGAPRPVIRIGQIDLARGNVFFTDNFIKPNYTANMTGLSGSVTALASDSAEPAALTLTGKIDDEAPLDISGRLNPLAPKLLLDIEGRTKGVDLPRLTPYSVKYAGYPIVKGKLSMEVHYKVENEKLAATNHLFVDQLTFGERVESPTATKLPVLLAVKLLTNSRGEIDLHLPISGTLNDPKFSIGGIIVQVIINLLTKVVTAPFTLLASAFGGGEELGYVEFAPGAAALAPEQLKRVDALGKALNERPALKVDIIGRVDPAADAEGVRQVKYEGKLKAAKVRQLVRSGGAAVDPATVTVGKEERAGLIETVYSNEEIADKPRNFIGLSKSIPAPEMEQLLLKHLAATPDDLRALANQRASAVRNRLENDGKVPRERLFLVEPKLSADGIQDKGAKTRVDFSLK